MEDGTIDLNYMLKAQGGAVEDWVKLAQDMEYWRVMVNAVWIFGFYTRRVIFNEKSDSKSLENDYALWNRKCQVKKSGTFHN